MEKHNLSHTAIKETAQLIEEFQRVLQDSEQELPSTRCISRTSLLSVLKRTREALTGATLRKYTSTDMIDILESAELLQRLPLKSPNEKKIDIYVVGFGGTFEPSALEILQAYRPAGTLCYFSALELHGLTTQPTPHYHLAELRRATGHTSNDSQHSPSDKPLPLGSRVFSVDDVPCFLTSRAPENLQGIQRRQLNPQCIVRVTTLEQTLLDCLHRPRSAGGPSVVFEAWTSATHRINFKKLWSLLSSIGDYTLMRRAGYMMENMKFDQALIDLIHVSVVNHAPKAPFDSLLPGIPYHNVSEKWSLRIP